MRRFAVIVVAFLVIPSFAFAACEGEDWRETLPPETIQALRAGIANVPFREGIAFEAVRGDTRLTLFGTVHVSHPAVFIPEEIATRIRLADLVFVEATSEIEKDMEEHFAANPSMLFDFDGPGLSTRLTAEEWDTLSKALSELGMPPEQVDRLSPGFAAMMLELAPCEVTALASGAELLDDRVEILARDAGVGVEGLDENFEQALAFFLGGSEEEQLQLLRLSLMAGATDDDAVATGIGVWIDEEPLVAWQVARERAASLAGDAEAVARLFREAYDMLIIRRHGVWLPRILNRSSEAQNVVIAVGALHLPGDQGLVRLLEVEEFTIRRLAVF